MDPNEKLFDKLVVEVSLKPAFAGLEVKELKRSLNVCVSAINSRRVIIKPSNPRGNNHLPDPCVPVVIDDNTFKDTPPEHYQFVFVSFKLASTNPRGTWLYIGKDDFVPQHDASRDTVFRLEADAVTYYSTGCAKLNEAFKLGVPPNIRIFNPSKDNVALDVKIGIGPIPPAKGKAAAVAGTVAAAAGGAAAALGAAALAAAEDSGACTNFS
ncbi:hypothetical protein [Zavarzinella formosa]|uniref:hypothetical protein n=1 Tax=Zavarzinella formosa TaxID=360055 RepID=UPI00030C8173|nr:hypothetical protein [Zavarzinella formosa]